MKDNFIIDELNLAQLQRKVEAGLPLHSSRGSQGAFDNHQKVLTTHASNCSMCRRVNCCDNATMKSFFGSLKTEDTYQKNYLTQDEARK
jgi:putative transposase